ncbi:hypothetical protein PVAP13_3KG109881 [Panicum virgatum]|uniref:Uncharacterized protein n=1 Tax=Panicum virgatum TaxID=38727 RepID=A0A8T0UQ41_PANVG|nr:hypothetical protein PVAP13_3KG109881 [Panicum virgatum]
MIEDMYTEEEKLQSAEASQNNPSGGGGGGTVVKPEHHHNTTTTALTAIGAGGGDQSHFRSAAASAGNNPSNSMLVSSSIVTDGDHLFSSCYPPASIHHGSHRHGAAVSLTLGLQQQQQPFIASGEATMMHQRSLMIHGDGEEEPVLPYRDLMGSQLLHDLTG